MEVEIQNKQSVISNHNNHTEWRVTSNSKKRRHDHSNQLLPFDRRLNRHQNNIQSKNLRGDDLEDFAENFQNRLLSRYRELTGIQSEDREDENIENEDSHLFQLPTGASSRLEPDLPNDSCLHQFPGGTSSPMTRLEPDDPNNSCLHQLAITNGDKKSNIGGGSANTMSRGDLLLQMFQRAPMKITRAVKQFMYDASGVEYLDCVNGTAHVGHCHPQVVSTGQQQMSKLVTAQGFYSDILKKYVKTLVETLPEPLSVAYLCNSGSEANDLALRLATQYTERDDVVVVDDGYHGNLGILVDISPKMHKQLPAYKKKDWVHVTKLPDQYRGQFQYDDEEAGLKYAKEVEKTILAAEAQGRKIAAFICEPFFVIPGVYPTPPSYFKHVYKIVRNHGGLVIADEVQTGLGRTGTHMWGFMNFGVVPDIVTIGKPLGNGHPMGAVVCSKEVSEKLGGYFSTFGGNPVSCSIGLSVLDIITNEKLVSSANMVGRHLHKSLEDLHMKYESLGDVRGCGLLQALEIVNNKQDKLPAPDLATEIMFGLKGKQVLVGITGRNRNVILFTPPMCFNIENSRRFIKSLEEVLSSLVTNSGRGTSVIVANVLQNRIGSKRSSESHHLKERGESIGQSQDTIKRVKLDDDIDDVEDYQDMD